MTKPGPKPLVLQGFDPETATTDGTESGTWWTPRSTVNRLLSALATGATWELAAGYARLHHSTPRTWNTRGQTLAEEHGNIHDYAATDPDPESLAYLAFYVAATEARSQPGILALDTITRAVRVDHDWKAALASIRINPLTKRDYAEVSRQEVSGPEGGPIQLADADRVAALLARADAQREPDDPDAAPPADD